MDARALDRRRGELTALGLRRVEAAVERHLAVERELIAALTDAQQEQLAGLLRRLLIAVDDQSPGDQAAESAPVPRARGPARTRARPRRPVPTASAFTRRGLTVDYDAIADLAAALIRCARAEAAPAPTVSRPGPRRYRG